MADYITLLGADSVQNAGRVIQGSAEEMARAAGEITEAVRMFGQHVDTLAQLIAELKEMKS